MLRRRFNDPVRSKNCLAICALFVLAFFFVIAPPLESQENNGIITSVEVIGLERTKEHVVRYPLESFLGREGAGLDMHEVQAAVRGLGILEPVDEELIETGEGLILQVTVEERWTIFPAPMLSINSGDYNFGLIVLETNAFGLRNLAGIGAMFGTSGWMTIAMYQHRGHMGHPDLNTFFMYRHLERKDFDRDRTVHRQYTMDHLRLSQSIIYSFSSFLSLSATLSFRNIALRENDESFNQPTEGAMLLGFNPELFLRTRTWDGILLSEQSLSLGYAFMYGLKGSSFHELSFRAVFEQPLLPGFRINMRSGAVWKSTGDVLHEEGPQRAQVEILPRRYSASNYAGFSAGLEKHIINTRFATLAAQGSWQWVFSEGSISGLQFDHGPSAGLRLYFNRVAMPPFSKSLAYNINSGRFQIAVTIGMEFS